MRGPSCRKPIFHMKKWRLRELSSLAWGHERWNWDLNQFRLILKPLFLNYQAEGLLLPLGFLGGSDDKASACNMGDLGSIPVWEDPLEKEMATHSSTFAWKIPWAEEPGRLQSIGSQRVKHNGSILACTQTFYFEMIHMRLYSHVWASPMSEMVKNLPAGQETWVWPLGWEDTLEKEMATRSSIPAWRIPGTEEPGVL